jgi:cyclopropane fatty-acyl-phospholipid synthase-like methyltransferase
MADGHLAPTPTGGWSDEAQVSWYLDRIGRLEARQAGERMLVDVLPMEPQRVLDLGCGDGRLAALLLASRASVVEVVAVDCSAPMLERARDRFAGDERVTVRYGDLREPMTPLGDFDVIVSGFAIHHLDDRRKQSLFREVASQVRTGGVFVNLEVVASATARWHAEFLTAIGRTEDDPEDRLASVEDQVAWMREAGMENVDCLWRWRGFALMVAERT